jgi:hypothetical protein
LNPTQRTIPKSAFRFDASMSQARIRNRELLFGKLASEPLLYPYLVLESKWL